MKNLVILTATLGVDGEPPKEFRIWPYGAVKTEKGNFTLPKENAQAIAESWQKRGVEVAFDYDHASYDAAAAANGDAPAAGWFTPEAREDGLYATNITWTTKAYQRIKDREYRYFSPAFYVDENDRITVLENVSILNNPATHEIEPLVAGARMKQGTDHRPIKTGALVLSFTDISARLREAVEEVFGWEAYITDVYADTFVFSYDSKTFQVSYTVTDTGVSISGDAQEVTKVYEKVEGGEVMKGLLVMLGAGENATEAQGIAAAQRLIAGNEGLLRLTGAASPDAALAVATKWKADAEKLTGIEAERATEKAEAEKAERERLIETGMTSGQIPPAMREYWGKRPLADVQEFLTSAPKSAAVNDKDSAVKTAGNNAAGVPAAGGSAGTVVMTSAIEQAAKAMGVSPEDVVKHAEKVGGKWGE